MLLKCDSRPGSATPVGPVSLQQLRDAWPEILEVVQNAKRAAWMVVFTSTARALDGDVLTLTFPSEKDVASFRQGPAAGDSVSEHLRSAIQQVLGIRVKFIARVDTEAAAPAPAAAASGWAVTADPDVGRAGSRADRQAGAREGRAEARRARRSSRRSTPRTGTRRRARDEARAGDQARAGSEHAERPGQGRRSPPPSGHERALRRSRRARDARRQLHRGESRSLRATGAVPLDPER